MPPAAEPPSHIGIKVKVPPGYLSTTDSSSGTDSFSLREQIPTTATVGTLRQHIQQLIPTHPAPERQRLLYGGRALVDNEQRLGDAFNVKRDPSQTEYVVHLLVKGEQGAADSGPTHQRAVSTPSAQTPGGQQQPHPQMPLPQAPPGQRLPFAGPHFPPPQHGFPQIIARNQQMRAGMGMHGVGGQQAHGPAQAQAQAQAQPNTQTEQTPGQLQENAGQTQAGNTQQPQQGHQPPHAPGRPISGQGFHVQGVGPNGQRFQIHQQMMQFPLGGGAMPSQVPFGFPGMPQGPGMMPGMGAPHTHHGLANHPPQQNGPSALERARENMAEMRRVLEEMRFHNTTSEEQQRQIDDIQQRAQALNSYIDPLQLGNATRPTDGQRPIPTPARSANPTPFQPGMPPLHNAPRRPAVPIPSAIPLRFQPPSNSNEVTAYLLSSPQGPQALLFSPQHGVYTGSFARDTRPQPTPTTTEHQPAHPPAQHPQPDPVAQAAARAAQELQVQHAQLHAAQANQQAQAGQDGGPVQALLGHFWLLLRIMIAAYFFLGTNMGWQRPLALGAIFFTFWLVRAGALGDGAAVRRWWEGVIGLERPPQRAGQAQGEGEGQQRNGMPTPEQVAQRLLEEQAARERARNAWWRERVRPLERALALFVASLWPGVGEATVRARREAEEARRAEEERVERERREAEESAAGEGGGGKGEAEGTAEPGGKKDGVAESSAVEGAEGVEGLRERRAVDQEAAAAGGVQG